METRKGIQDTANEPTQSTLFDLGMPSEAYYAEFAQYLNNYMWEIEDRFPTSDSTLWHVFE